MSDRLRTGMLRSMAKLLLAGALLLTVAACGAGGNQAATLLRQTFTGQHKTTSGNLGLSLTVTPSGASALKGPLTISLGGPFQSLGPGRLPQSDFTLGVGVAGGSFSVAIVSTGTKGYVTFGGESYQLPQATFQRLESSFAQLGSSSRSRAGSGVLAKLGIQPEHWLVNPQVVGDEAFGGTNTAHIHAGIDVPALLADLNTFLSHASSVGAAGATNLPRGISAAARGRIAGEVRNASVDVWTGATDKTLRRLDLRLGLDLTGQAAALLGPSATVRLTMQYADLNQPQSISAPTTLLPYSQFQARLRVLLADLQGGLVGGLSGGTGTAGKAGSGTSTNYEKYTQCIQAAGGDIAKMQKCTPLLSGG